MNKNAFSTTALSRYALSLTALTLAACGGRPPQTPNIIFIYADDMGYGDVSGLNPDSQIATPHIDRLIQNGVTFTDAHTCSSVSTPSRYGLLTGRYNWRSPLKDNVLYGYDGPIIPATRTTLASMLKTQGYHTACIGKWHLGWNWNNVEAGPRNIRYDQPITQGPTSLGFDYFYGIAASLDMPPYVYVENDMPTAVPDHYTRGTGMSYWRSGPTAPDFVHEQTLPHFVDQAVAYIGRQSVAKNPYFLYLPLPAPHTPIIPTQEYKGTTGLNDYGDFVVMVDDMVGRVLQAVEDAGQTRQTLVVFSTDNGCSPQALFDQLAAKGHYPSYLYRGYKADLFEGGHRVPCVVSWPGHLRPHTVSSTVCLTDFMATFAQLTGYQLKDNEGEDSFSLLPFLMSSDRFAATPRREATVHHSIDGYFSIRQGPWKLLACSWSGGWSYPTLTDSITATLPAYQLYNMEDDPAESTNVWETHPQEGQRLLSLLEQYKANGRSTPGAPQENDPPR